MYNKNKPKQINRSPVSVLANERGLITFDFIFAFVLTISISMVFFAVAVTLSLVEAAQYVTYTTSRAYAAAHETQAMQSDLGMARYAEVMAEPAFKSFLGSTWMKLGPAALGDYSTDYQESTQNSADVFVGARIPIDAQLLHLQVPFLGATIEDSSVGKATLNSYLMREVSTTECREGFNRQRYQQLKNASSGGSGSYSGAPTSQEKLITDNGC